MMSVDRFFPRLSQKAARTGSLLAAAVGSKKIKKIKEWSEQRLRIDMDIFIRFRLAQDKTL